MTAIIKRPGQPAFTREIENTLKAFQDLERGHRPEIPEGWVHLPPLRI